MSISYYHKISLLSSMTHFCCCCVWVWNLPSWLTKLSTKVVGTSSHNNIVCLSGVSWYGTVWWMRVGNYSQLPSISAFSTDLKRIETPHRLFRDLGAGKTFTTRWSGGTQWQISSLSPRLSPCWSSGNHYRRLFERQSKVLTAKSMAELLGARSGTAGGVGWASINTGCFRVGCSRCWQRLARLRETCYHSWDTDLAVARVQKVLMICTCWAKTHHLFLLCKWNYWWNWGEVVADQSSRMRRRSTARTCWITSDRLSSWASGISLRNNQHPFSLW